MSDRERIIDKIKKCLALSASSNEHEAEAALRQARKLMDTYGISDLDVEAAAASERRAKAGARCRPSNWETCLASKIADTFGCQLIFAGGMGGEWAFIGCAAAPEISEYAFKVLYRQALRARDAHIEVRLKRCKPGTKTRRADLFCEGWVQSVTGKIAAFAGTADQSQAIDIYVANRYRNLASVNARDRNAGRNLRNHEYGDWAAGRRSGKDAELNRGVGSAERLALE